VESSVFDYIDDVSSTVFELTPMQKLSEAGKLGVYRHYGFWHCMDSARDKRTLEDFWQNGSAHWKVWKD